MPGSKSLKILSTGALALLLIGVFYGTNSYIKEQQGLPSPTCGGITPSCPIQHIVIIMQENIPFDHFFAEFPGVNDTSFGLAGEQCIPKNLNDSEAGIVCPFDADDNATDVWLSGEPHGYQSSHYSYNNGKMNGFFSEVTNYGTSLQKAYADNIMSYVTGKSIPYYWDLASQFALDANFYSSALSYSWPNHIELVAAQVPPACTSSTQTGTGGADQGSCDPEYNLTMPVIVNQLDAAGVTWKYFQDGWNDSEQCTPITTHTSTVSTTIKTIRSPYTTSESTKIFKTIETLTTHTRTKTVTSKSTKTVSKTYYTESIKLSTYTTTSVDTPSLVNGYWNILVDWPGIETNTKDCYSIDNAVDLYNDLNAGYLPQVSFVMPNVTVSDHAGTFVSRQQSEEWIASIVDGIESNPNLWNSTAIFLTWDDYGGFYDSMPPQQVDNIGLSFRMPLIVISPWVKQGISYGYQSQHEQDFTSFLSTIESNWNLQNMTDRDGTAEPLWFLFNFSQTPLPPLILPYQTFSATYPVSTCSSCLVGMPAQPIKFDSAQLAHQSNITLPPPDDDGDPYD